MFIKSLLFQLVVDRYSRASTMPSCDPIIQCQIETSFSADEAIGCPESCRSSDPVVKSPGIRAWKHIGKVTMNDSSSENLSSLWEKYRASKRLLESLATDEAVELRIFAGYVKRTPELDAILQFRSRLSYEFENLMKSQEMFCSDFFEFMKKAS